MSEQNIPLETVLGWNPCSSYKDESRMREVMGGDTITPSQVSEAKIPVMDRLWVLLRTEIIPAKKLHLLACMFAEGVLDLYEQESDDKRPREGLEAKKAWTTGADKDKLVAARKAVIAAQQEAESISPQAKGAITAVMKAMREDPAKAATGAVVAAAKAKKRAIGKGRLDSFWNEQLVKVVEVL